MRKALTSLASILSAVLAVCWGSANAQDITLEIVTDLWGYEAYWEMTPVGDPCGTNTIASGGNTLVGCAGGGLQLALPGDPGSYASLSTIPLGSVGTAPLCFDFHIIDDFGDGGNIYNFYVDGILQASYTHTVFGDVEVYNVCLVTNDSGCTDIEAANYDPTALTDDGSCVVPSCNAGSGVEAVASQSGSYCYNSNEITGFTVIADAGETVTLVFTGGTVEAGFDLITVYDGNSSAFPVIGSFDGPAAGQVFQSTGGALYFELTSDTLWSCVEGQIAGPLTWDIYCASAVPGCTDQDALNYNSAATVDDGSCDFIPCDADDNVPPTADGTITYCYDSNVVQGFGFTSTNPGVDSPSIFIVQGNFEPTFDTFTVYDGADNTATIIASGDGSFAGQLFTASGDDLYIEIVSDGSVSCVSSATYIDLIVDYYCATAVIPGCTDNTATNYNPDATVDDGSCVYPPVNNDCLAAIALQCEDLVTGTTLNATDTEGFIGGGGCGVPITSPGVWYVFNGTGDLVTLATCNNTMDTRISVFTGSCGALVCDGGADDGNGTAGCAIFSTQYSFVADAGVDYYIYVHGFGTATGDFDLSLSCQPDPCAGVTPPANDDCSAAQLFIDGFTFTPDLCCTSPEGNVAQQCSFNSTQGVWYVYSNAGNFDDIFFDVVNQGPAGSFIGLSVYLADPLAAPGTECDNLQILGCCQDFAGQCQGSMALIPGATPLVPGGLYFFNVWTSTPDACGTVAITATGLINGCTDPAADNFDNTATQDDGSCTYSTPPANDLCADAVVMTCNTTETGSTGLATTTGAPACGATYPGVWYQWTGTGDFVTVSTCGSNIDSYLRVLEGPCGGPFTCIAFEDDDIGTCGFFDADDASIDFFSTLGASYYFYVSGFAGQQGTFDISVACSPVLAGCTDETAENYDPAANVDDGTCNYTWANACGENYEICYDNFANQAYTYCSPNVGTDAVIVTFGANSVVEAGFDILNIYDGSDNTGTLLFSGDGDVSGLSFGGSSGCLTIEIISDAVVNCADGQFVLGVNFDITCEPIVFGCTNPSSPDYDPAANIDDGSCTFCGVQFAYCYGSSENYVQTFNGGPGENVQIDIVQGVFEAGFDLFTIYDGPNTASPILFSGDGDVSGGTFVSSGNSLTIQIVSDFVISCAEGNLGTNTTLLIDVLCGLAGCDNPIACNYDPAAIFLSCDLCEYSTCLGCTYPDADNYNGPGIDDGTCVFTLANNCPADINGDGFINTGDLTALLGNFGTICP